MSEVQCIVGLPSIAYIA